MIAHDAANTSYLHGYNMQPITLANLMTSQNYSTGNYPSEAGTSGYTLGMGLVIFAFLQWRRRRLQETRRLPG
jgi:Na+/pantothenate symporter